MRKFLLLLSFFGVCLLAQAQQDSLVVAKAKWETKKIARGIKLMSCWFRDGILFNSNQNITILEVKPERKIEFDLAAETKEKKTTSQFGKEKDAMVALNGTFFDVTNGGSVDYIRVDGSLVNGNRLENGLRARHQRAAVVVDNGMLSLRQWDGTPEWEEEIKGEDVLVSGPMLLTASHVVLSDTSSFSLSRHPRTVVAISSDKRVWLITVDGRHVNSAGMSLPEIAKVLRWMRCKEAINLDGGGSTTLWVKNETENGVVNYPSDNKQWDHDGERKVANVIIVKRRR